MPIISLALLALGAVLIACGVALLSIPSALIVCGLYCLAVVALLVDPDNFRRSRR